MMCVCERVCIGLPARYRPTDIGNHLLRYDLSSFAVPLCTVVNGLVDVQKE